MNKDRKYGADSIDMLNDIESVRLKAGMYCGDLGTNGLHHLIWEILSNSADEAINGNGNHITVSLLPDNYVEVTDNGSGIPVGLNKKYNMDALDLIMLYKHSGGKLRPEDTTYKKGSIGTNGLGLFIANCLSEKLIVTSRREKKVFQGVYGLGKRISPVKEIGTLTSNITGTSIKWLYDKKIFVYDSVYQPERIEAKLSMICHMLPKVKLTFVDGRDPKKVVRKEFYSENGLIDLLAEKLRGKTTILRNMIHLREDVNHMATKYDDEGKQYQVQQTINIELCFNFDPVHREEKIFTYVNGNDIPLGGTMVTGFKRGLVKAINEFARESKLLKDKDVDFKYNELKDGLTCAIHIGHPDPSFDGQTKVKINNQELDSLTSTATYMKMARHCIDFPKEMEKLVDYFVRLRKGRAASERALDNELKKVINPQGKNVMLGQYVTEASSSNRKECELYIVEGKSALSSCKEARDSRTQAVLPLRGKLINTYKGALQKVLKNEEVQAIIKVVGTGSTHSNNFDIDKSRYGKIIIMADADVK